MVRWIWKRETCKHNTAEDFITRRCYVQMHEWKCEKLNIIVRGCKKAADDVCGDFLLCKWASKTLFKQPFQSPGYTEIHGYKQIISAAHTKTTNHSQRASLKYLREKIGLIGDIETQIRACVYEPQAHSESTKYKTALIFDFTRNTNYEVVVDWLCRVACVCAFGCV